MTSDEPTGKDIAGARETYSGFLGLLKWGAIASAALTVLVVLLIA